MRIEANIFGSGTCSSKQPDTLDVPKEMDLVRTRRVQSTALLMLASIAGNYKTWHWGPVRYHSC